MRGPFPATAFSKSEPISATRGRAQLPSVLILMSFSVLPFSDSKATLTLPSALRKEGV